MSLLSEQIVGDHTRIGDLEELRYCKTYMYFGCKCYNIVGFCYQLVKYKYILRGITLSKAEGDD